MTDGAVPGSARASLDDLDRAPAVLPQRPGPIDYRSQLETLQKRFADVTTEKERLQQDFDDLLRRSSTIEELDKLIGPSAKNAFSFMCAYSAGTFCLLILDGSHWKGFSLKESVLDFLVGSTAATVIGLVGMVLTGIFVGARKAVADAKQ